MYRHRLDGAGAGKDPVDQLAAVFDALGRWHTEPAFRGCAILNAATQHHDRPARAVAARHLGRRLTLLVGATVLADHHGDTDTAEHAKQAALALLRPPCSAATP